MLILETDRRQASAVVKYKTINSLQEINSFITMEMPVGNAVFGGHRSKKEKKLKQTVVFIYIVSYICDTLWPVSVVRTLTNIVTYSHNHIF